MIHYWECKRCTRQWTSCCFGHLFMNEEDKALDDRKPYDLCTKCFLELEKSTSDALPILLLKQKLEKKKDDLQEVIESITASLGFGYNHKLEEHLRSLGVPRKP